MKDCKYVAVDGNHQTMLYAENAAHIVDAIEKFLL
jgi:thioesterase domain-containing protein